MNPLLEQFLSEARDNLSYIDKHLQSLSSCDPEMMNALFRAAHTLKGGSGLVGLNNIKDITHHAEDLLDALRKNKVVFQEDMIEALYDLFDEIIEIIDAVEESNGEIEYDAQKVAAVSDPIKKFLVVKEEKQLDQTIPLETELIIEKTLQPIAQLISNYNFATYIKDLEFHFPTIDQKFIENENIYLIDFDLPHNSVEFGNDPIYLISLLREENILSINTYICKKSEEVLENPIVWSTRICVLARGDSETFEDIFYNILDDIIFYPICVESLFQTDFPSESIAMEVFEDFSQELELLLEQKDFTDLSEKIIAICKIFNPDSKEAFLLNRLLALLETLDFGSVLYEKVVKLACEQLAICKKEPQIQEPQQETKEILPETKIAQELTTEEKTAIDIFGQQLKVLQQDKTEGVLERVLLHITNITHFLEIEKDFENIHEKSQLEEKIQALIASLQEKETAFKKHDTQSTAAPIQEETKPIEEKKEIPAPAEKTIPKDAISHTAVPKTVKIDQADIDSMMDIVGEIMVIKNSLPYVAQNLTLNNVDSTKRELYGKYEMMNRIIEQLQDKVMGMRLLPLSYIFSRYPKLVRDISKRLHKKIQYLEEGGDTKLDKTMIEQLADPLVHIIRNSLDHGIEENRLELGKTEEGTIKISAKSYGDKVHIVVEDDGRGIDLEKVISKALENNLASVHEIEAMNDNEKYMLIFHPGLSTKDEISDLSGRGVGTDAMKKTVDALGGKIEIQSQKGVGTKLTMILPVSVALTKVFHISMGGQNYAIPMEQVVETLKIKKEDIVTSNHKPFITLRGDLIPILFVDLLLGNNYKTYTDYNILVIQGNNTLFGVIVDEFVNQLDVIQKPLEGVLASHPLISGTSLLGSGEILFIIDSSKLIN